MPFSFAQFATVAETSLDSTTENVSLLDAGIYSGLGAGIVFLVLIVLMVFIGIMSYLLRGQSEKTAEKPVVKAQNVEKPVEKKVEVAAKSVASAPSAVPEGAMFVTLGGKKHTVTVVEKIPQFTVKINGKTHFVDVEPVQEGEA